MITVLIPAAGDGKRFAEAGYKEPKPLIDVLGKPMLRHVIDNLRPTSLHTCVVVSKLDYGDGYIQSPIGPIIHTRVEQTDGAVDTILRAKFYITDKALLIGNCDQLVDFNVDDFIAAASGFDGALVTFKSNKPHHSYVRTDDNGYITTIAEKVVISHQAVTGVYYFSNGLQFVEHAEEAMRANDTFNGEFYVSSVIGRMVRSGLKLTTYDAPSVMLGTPEELQLFEVAVSMGRKLS